MRNGYNLLNDANYVTQNAFNNVSIQPISYQTNVNDDIAIAASKKSPYANKDDKKMEVEKVYVGCDDNNADKP